MSVLCPSSAETLRFPIKLKIDDYNEIPSFREHVRTLLNKMVGGDAGLLYLGFNEALNNTIVHSGASKKPVTIKLNVIANRILIIRIKNWGRSFPGNKLLANIRTMEKNPFETVLDQASNRGLILIDMIFSKVLYNRNGTEIMMIKPLEDNAKWKRWLNR